MGGKQPYSHPYFLYGHPFLTSWYYADSIVAEVRIRIFADVRWVGFLPPVFSNHFKLCVMVPDTEPFQFGRLSVADITNLEQNKNFLRYMYSKTRRRSTKQVRLGF